MKQNLGGVVEQRVVVWPFGGTLTSTATVISVACAGPVWATPTHLSSKLAVFISRQRGKLHTAIAYSHQHWRTQKWMELNSAGVLGQDSSLVTAALSLGQKISSLSWSALSGDVWPWVMWHIRAFLWLGKKFSEETEITDKGDACSITLFCSCREALALKLQWTSSTRLPSCMQVIQPVEMALGMVKAESWLQTSQHQG